jgi:Na+-driven multidrug efflux pump
MFCTNGVLRGAGDTMVPMYNTLFAMCLVRLPVAYLLSRTSLVFFGKTINLNLGSNGIWWGQPTAWLCGFLLAYTYYRRGNWKTKYKEIIAIPID